MKWFWKVVVGYVSLVLASLIVISSRTSLSLAFSTVSEIVFSGSTLNSFEDPLISGLILPILIIFGFFTQFILILTVISFISRYLIKQKPEVFIEEFLSLNLPLRQILISLFISVTIISTIIFKVVENRTWLNSIYFTMVTMSTVGYGDVVATQTSTKVITIILIINGISGIAIASQLVVNRIVRMQLQTTSNVPRSMIEWEGHVIIGGYGSKGRKLVQLFLDRKYQVIVIDRDKVRISVSNETNLRIINADISKSSLLKLLSLEKATGLFLMLSDDNPTLQTGIIAKSLAPDLDVYAEMQTVPTYDIARYAGINRPISLFHFLLNVINANLRHQERYMIDTISDMKTYEGKLGFVVVPSDYEFSEIFSEVIEVGSVNLFLNEFIPQYDPSLVNNLDDLDKSKQKLNVSHLLLAVNKEELFDKQKYEIFENQPIAHKRVIFAGFPDFADEFINRLGIGVENTIILWQTESEQEILNTKEYTNFQWTLENGISLLQRIVKDDDLIISTFEDITSSMLVGVTLKNLDLDTHLIQLAPYEHDIEPLIQIGAEAVITPQRIISEAMINSYTKINNIAPSIIYTNGHVYEHLVSLNDRFDGSRISDLYQDGFQVLYINPKNEDKFIESLPQDRIQSNDRILVFVPY